MLSPSTVSPHFSPKCSDGDVSPMHQQVQPNNETRAFSINHGSGVMQLIPVDAASLQPLITSVNTGHVTPAQSTTASPSMAERFTAQIQQRSADNSHYSMNQQHQYPFSLPPQNEGDDQTQQQQASCFSNSESQLPAASQSYSSLSSSYNMLSPSSMLSHHQQQQPHQNHQDVQAPLDTLITTVMSMMQQQQKHPNSNGNNNPMIPHPIHQHAYRSAQMPFMAVPTNNNSSLNTTHTDKEAQNTSSHMVAMSAAHNSRAVITPICPAQLQQLQQLQPIAGSHNSWSPCTPKPNQPVPQLVKVSPNITIGSNNAATALQTLSSVRGEATDARVRTRLLGLSKARCQNVANYLLTDQPLLWRLLSGERGSVPATLIEKLGKLADGLVYYVLSNIKLLSQDKGGCVALPRILQHVTVAERASAFQILRADPGAATHQYANFVLQYYIDGGNGKNGLGTEGRVVLPSASEVCSMLIHEELSDSQTLLRWSLDKFGSRVVDKVLNHATAPDVRVLLGAIFSDENLVRSLGVHEFGHFNLKSAFEVLLEGQLKDAPDQPQLLRQYHETAAPLLKHSRFSRVRAALLQVLGISH